MSVWVSNEHQVQKAAVNVCIHSMQCHWLQQDPSILFFFNVFSYLFPSTFLLFPILFVNVFYTIFYLCMFF